MRCTFLAGLKPCTTATFRPKHVSTAETAPIGSGDPSLRACGVELNSDSTAEAVPIGFGGAGLPAFAWLRRGLAAARCARGGGQARPVELEPVIGSGLRSIKTMVLIAMAMVALARPVLGQEAVLSGRVIDTQGAAVPDADIALTREDGAVARQAQSSSQGDYRIERLPAGVFIVEVSKSGFRRHTAVVTLSAGSPASLDVELGVGGIEDSVVVTAAGGPQITQETSRPITIVDAREIQARNENTLSEIVRFVPGVQIKNNGGPGQLSSMRIRGLRSDAAAVLVDGLRFRDAATAQGDVTSFLSNVNFIAADRVEVLRGSGSSLYGTNAVGGVVNVVTRAGGGPARSEGQFEAGSLGHVRARGSIGGGALDDRLSFSAGLLQYNVLDGLDGHDAMRSSGGHGLVQYNASPSSSLMVRVFGSDDRVDSNVSPTASGIPVANIPNTMIVEARPVAPDQIALANQGLPFDVGNATYIPGRDDPDYLRTSSFYTTALIFRHSGWSPVSWQASYQRVHTDREYRNGVLGAGFQPRAENLSDFVGDIDTIDLRGFMNPVSWLRLTAGYEFERERYFERQDDQLPTPARVRTETRIRQDANAAFGSAQVALFGRRLQLGLSGRVQGFSLSNPEFSVVGTINPYDSVATPAPPRAETGDISLAYFLPSTNTKVRVHGGNAYRAPGLFERFGGGFFNDPVTGVVVFSAYGDPRLQPDRYKSIDAGVDQYLFDSRLFVSATVFYNDVTSITAFDSAGKVRPETDPYGRSGGYLNGLSGFSRGVEIGAEARPTSTLRLSGSYTYTRSETDQDVTIPGFYRVPGVFGHTATLVVTNQWNHRLDTTFDLFTGSSQYMAFSAAGRPRAYEFPGFTKAAVIAGYRLLDRDRWPLRIYAKVDNLFDETYYEGGWRNLGRTAVVGASVGF